MDGAAVVANFLGKQSLAQLNSEFNILIANESPGSQSTGVARQRFHGKCTKRVCGLAAKSSGFVDLMLRPELRAYSDHFLLKEAEDYWLNTGQLMVVGPGEPAQIIHRDEGNWPYFKDKPGEVTVSAIFALEDFTSDNGATLVVPGSHRWEPERVPKQEETTQAVMSAGSALFYLGKVLHGAGENRSKRWRRGLHISYVLAWLRPEEHHSLHVSERFARTLPQRAQVLLGFTTYSPQVGGRLGLVDFQEVHFQAIS